MLAADGVLQPGSSRAVRVPVAAHPGRYHLDRLALLLQLRAGAGVRRVRRRGACPQHRHRQGGPAGAVVVPLGRPQHLRHRHPHHDRHRGLLRQRLRQAGRRHRDQHRHAARHHHDAQRVGRDLAESEGRAGQRRQRARRRRGRPGRGSSRPQGVHGVAAEHLFSVRCCSSWSSRATARAIGR